jgi:hypothetical protein
MHVTGERRLKSLVAPQNSTYRHNDMNLCAISHDRMTCPTVLAGCSLLELSVDGKVGERRMYEGAL